MAALLGKRENFGPNTLDQETNCNSINANSTQQTLLSAPQDDCVNGEHLWLYMGSSSEACYVGESECLVSNQNKHKRRDSAQILAREKTKRARKKPRICRQFKCKLTTTTCCCQLSFAFDLLPPLANAG